MPAIVAYSMARFRHYDVWFRLKISPPPAGRFMLNHAKYPCSRFMEHRLEPYEGWRDRMSGYYGMDHNKHRAYGTMASSS